MHEQNLVETVAKGALAGLVGTAALSLGMKNAPALMAQLGVDPKSQSTHAGQQPTHAEEPTEKLARQVGDKVLHTRLDRDQQALAGQAIHWGYGAAWGALYGLTQSHLPGSPHLQGLLLGGLVGAVASTAVPALGLTPPPTQQPAAQTTMMTGLHLLYGWVTAATFQALGGSGTPQRRRVPRQGQWAGPVEASQAGVWPDTPAQGGKFWRQTQFNAAGTPQPHPGPQRPRNGGSTPGDNEQPSTGEESRAGVYYAAGAQPAADLPLAEMATWRRGAQVGNAYTQPDRAPQQCQEVMTRDPVCCTPGDRVEQVAQIMRNEDTGVVPVVEDQATQKLLGVVTDRDLVVRVLATGSTADTMTVEQVMTRNPVVCHPEDDVQRALQLMADHQLRRVPVVDDEGHIVGIIAQADIARRVEEPEQVAEVVEQISQPA